MRRQQCGSLTLYNFPELQEAGAHHAIATRVGGISQGHLATLNVSYSVKDVAANVAHNRRLLFACLGADENRVVACYQVHTTNVVRVTASVGGRGAIVPNSGIPATDAMITDEQGLYLFMTFADCVPVLLYDPVRRVLGLAHAGWRGTVGNIAGKTVEAMTQAFACAPADVLAAVGPAVGPCHYEVREDVAGAVRGGVPFWGAVMTENEKHPGSYILDLPQTNRLQLLAAGLKDEHVSSAGLCTACHTDEFYSHRAEGATGRFGVLIGMTNHDGHNRSQP